MNKIRFSADQKFVEAWHNGQKVHIAPVSIYSLHGSVSVCRDYLREWTGEEPTIEKELKEAMDRADCMLIRLAFGK